MTDFNWEVVVHGVPRALQGLQMENKMLGAATGAGIGMGSVLVADGIMDRLMQDPDKHKTPLQAAATGTMETIIGGMAMSLMLDNPITWTTVGLNTLYGAAEGTIVHSLMGEVDWNTNWLGWN